MKSLKICLVLYCLSPFQAIGTPVFDGATFFMKEIIINSKKHGRHVVLVDDSDYDRVSKFKWCVDVFKNTMYAQRKHERKTVRMHRFILGVTDPKIEIDHKDHNGLNNMRSNIRACTKSQNNANKNKSKKLGASSKYVGVSKHACGNRWKVSITKDYKSLHVGLFKSEESAAIAYNKAALKLFGEFATINNI